MDRLPWVFGDDEAAAAALDTQFLHANPSVRLAHYISRADRGGGDCPAAAATKPMHGRVWFGLRATGPPGHAHGGAQAAVLDEVMGGLCWHNDFHVLAGEITVRFLRPFPLGTDAFAYAQIDRITGRKLRVSAELAATVGGASAGGEGGQRLVFARSHGTFIQIDSDDWPKRAVQ